MVSPASRHDLTDAQWAVSVPLLPPPTGRGPRASIRCGAWSTVRVTAGGVSVAGRSGPVRRVVAGVYAVRC
jgi:transposase